MLDCISKSRASGSKEVIISLFLALAKPHLEYGVQLPLSPMADAVTLEGAQRGLKQTLPPGLRELPLPGRGQRG